MIFLISDPRLHNPDPALALMIDLLRRCVTLKDFDFMFPELSFVGESTWRVPVDSNRALRFEIVEGFGPVQIRLE